MEKYFGFGEYERTDVEVRASTWHFRHHFLSTLWQQKGNWAKHLLRLANFDLLPPEFIEQRQINTTFSFIFPCLFKKKPYDFDLRLDVLDTPLYHYFSYFFDKENEIENLKNDIERIRFNRTEFDLRKDALRTLIPDWNSLKSKDDAQNLFRSLENWAKAYNLNEDWCLDYALLALSNFNSYLDGRFKDFDFQAITQKKINNYTFHFEHGIREALRNALYDYKHEKVISNLWKINEDLKVIPFNFKHKAFENIPATWFPLTTRRKEFFDETLVNYQHQINEIKHLDQFKNIDKEHHRITLNNYCNEIEKLKSENNNEDLLPRYPPFPNISGGIIIYSAVWKPSLENRESFIRNFIIELNRRFGHIKRMARSLETIGKDDFESALWIYCNKVEKNIPKNYAKTPTKYSSQTHFEWLIDYQVPSVKEYREIAEEIDANNRPTVDAIKKGIKRLSCLIGISLRKNKSLGRPKGVVEIRKRHRVKKIEVGTF
jgi:hypothetical protein